MPIWKISFKFNGCPPSSKYCPPRTKILSLKDTAINPARAVGIDFS
ncbi:MAG TPA: hypothetical protein VE445_08805 [Nitrososphaeraceae archaeon]|nr:hypothetical protein [Nitrososphaeraceae archaeon]